MRHFDPGFCIKLYKKLTYMRAWAFFTDNENLLEFLKGTPDDDLRFVMKVIYGEQAMIAFAHGDIATMDAIINQERLNWMYQWDNHELDLISKGLLLTM